MRSRRGPAVMGALMMLAACTDAGPRVASTTTVVREGATAATTAATTGSTGSTGSDGVPGLDDPDAFCAAWAAYGGTLQAIGVAQAFGGSSTVEVARLEVVAAASLVAAVDGIGRNWPADLLQERSDVLSSLIGPYGRRAQKALSMLTDAGATDLDLEQFQKLWTDALRSRTDDQPVIELPPLSSELEDLVKPVAALFDSQVTPFGDDPSLHVEGVDAPQTIAYLAQHCPDLKSSGVGDMV